MSLEYEVIVPDTGSIEPGTRIYSKQVLKKDPQFPYILYATLDGTAFLCMEFQPGSLELQAIHHCGQGAKGTQGTESGRCKRYAVFVKHPGNRTKAFFDTVYSFAPIFQKDTHRIRLKLVRLHMEPAGEECLIKPIIQTRGFCYYHSVLHAMLIPEVIKNFACSKVSQYMKRLAAGNTRYSLDTFQNIHICEQYAAERPKMVAENTEYYVMKFFYQYLFHFEELHARVSMSQVAAHKKFLASFSTSRTTSKAKPTPSYISTPVDILVKARTGHEGTLSTLPEGGYVFETGLYMLKDLMKLSFAQDIAATNTEDCIYHSVACPNGLFKSYVLQLPSLPDTYTLQFALISLHFYDLRQFKTVPGHAIVGVVCGGERYILNSAGDQAAYFKCDWLNIPAIVAHPNLASYFKPNNPQEHITELRWNGFFVKNTIAPAEDTCAGIKATYITPRIFHAIQTSSLDPTIQQAINDATTRASVRRIERLFAGLHGVSAGR